MFVILEIHFSEKGQFSIFRMFKKKILAIILGVRNFRMFKILEHLPYTKFPERRLLIYLFMYQGFSYDCVPSN